MGVEFSNQCNECQSIISPNAYNISDNEKSKQMEIENRIEYQLKAYLSARDPGYDTLICANYKPSKSDSKLIRKLMNKSRQFSYNLIRQIFEQRFNANSDAQIIQKQTNDFFGECPKKNNVKKAIICKPKIMSKQIESLSYSICWSDFKEKIYFDLIKECKKGKIIKMNVKISPYCTLNEKYQISPPLMLKLYKKVNDNAKMNGVDCQSEKNEDSSTKFSVFVWIYRVFPELIPFLFEMQLQNDGICEDESERLQFVECVEKRLNVNDFVQFVDEYVALCNDFKKASKGKQYLLSPLSAYFDDGHVFVKQSIWKLKQSETDLLMKQIKLLFCQKKKAEIEWKMEGKKEYFDHAKTRKMMMKSSAHSIVEKLLKSNNVNNKRAQPLSV